MTHRLPWRAKARHSRLSFDSRSKDVDGRAKPGHDDEGRLRRRTVIHCGCWYNICISGGRVCPSQEPADACVARSATKLSETPSSPCAAIVATASAKAAWRISALRACPARRAASFRARPGDASRVLRRLRHAALCAGCDPPGSGWSSSLHPGRSELVPARGRHLHAERAALDHDETGVPKYDGYLPGRSYPIVTGP